MKKTFTATACTWTSYGSILQSLALQKKLQSMGYANSILICEKEPEAQLSRTFSRPRSVKRFVVEAHKAFIHANLNRRYVNSNEFIRQNMEIEYYGDYQSLEQQPPDAYAYIAGSDQIWHPGNMRPFFYLDFVEPGVTKVAYAASMGVTSMPAEKEERFRQYVQDFDFISVREEDNVAVVSRYVDVPISVNVDPVFLLSRDEWRTYERPYAGLIEPYILVFAIYWDARLNAQIKRLQKRTGLRVVAVSGGLQRVYANKRIYDADPAQFLWLIDHAEAVITSSFHGVAMSLVFNKPFSAVVNPSAPSRICCLLKTLGAKGMCIEDLPFGEGAGFDSVNDRIRKERARSEAYLRKALS